MRSHVFVAIPDEHLHPKVTRQRKPWMNTSLIITSTQSACLRLQIIAFAIFRANCGSTHKPMSANVYRCFELTKLVALTIRWIIRRSFVHSYRCTDKETNDDHNRMHGWNDEHESLVGMYRGEYSEARMVPFNHMQKTRIYSSGYSLRHTQTSRRASKCAMQNVFEVEQYPSYANAKYLRFFWCCLCFCTKLRTFILVFILWLCLCFGHSFLAPAFYYSSITSYVYKSIKTVLFRSTGKGFDLNEYDILSGLRTRYIQRCGSKFSIRDEIINTLLCARRLSALQWQRAWTMLVDSTFDSQRRMRQCRHRHL